MSRLPEYVFYAEDTHVYANLYTDCTADLHVGTTDLRIREETNYPRDGRVRFTLEPATPASFTFSVRIPRWANGAVVRVNGTPVTYKFKAGQMLNLPRRWRRGDTVELDFPMPVRTIRGRCRQSGRFAVMRGPVVYALDTRKIDAFRTTHPYDAQTVMMIDPTSLAYDAKDGSISARASTVEWAVGVADVSVDGKLPKNVCRVRLTPFRDEDNTLTYFRAPNLEEDCRSEDELLGPAAAETH